MGRPIDKERKRCESSIHKHDIDFCVTMVGKVDVQDVQGHWWIPILKGR